MDEVEDRTSQYQKQRKLNNLLLLSCVRGYIEDVSGLVEMGAQWNCKDKSGISTMHFAAAHGRLEIVKWLWSKGAELDWEDTTGRTPLHVAAAAGQTQVVDFLLANGAWIEGFDSRDDTPLHLAARAGHTEVVEKLLEYGGKAGSTNRRSLTPLGEGLMHGHVEAAAKLLDNGADLNVKSRGYTLTHLVAGSGEHKALQLIISRGAAVNDAANKERLSPLHCACMALSPSCVEALLKAGAQTEAVDAAGNRPDSYVEGDSEEAQRVTKILENWAVKPQAKKRNPVAAAAAPKAVPQKQKTMKDAFKELSATDRVLRIDRWSEKGAVELAVMMKDFPEEARNRAIEANKIKRLITLHKAMECLHNDDTFQSDMRQPGVRKAIDTIRAKPDTYEQFNSNPAVSNVMMQLRRYHALAKDNGFPQVNLDDLLVPKGKDPKAIDADHRSKLEAMLRQQIKAAAAAACEDTDEAAKKAAQDALVHVSEIEPEDDPVAPTPAQRARVPITRGKPDPKSFNDYFKLYFEELRLLTYDNKDFKAAFLQRCVMAVMLAVLGFTFAVFVRWMFPDMPQWFQRIGPGGPMPGMGFLQEMATGKKFGNDGTPRGGPMLRAEDLPVIDRVEL